MGGRGGYASPGAYAYARTSAHTDAHTGQKTTTTATLRAHARDDDDALPRLPWLLHCHAATAASYAVRMAKTGFVPGQGVERVSLPLKAGI